MPPERQAPRAQDADASRGAAPDPLRRSSADASLSRPVTDPVRLLHLQRQAGNAAVAGLLGPARRAGGPAGQPLEPSTRSRLESGLGADLSTMRLSLDGAAASREGAAAFTIGSQVVIDPAHYRPGTPSGDGLLAHEAAHVVQQSEAAASEPSESHDAGPELEAEADRAAVAVATEQRPAGGPIALLRAALSLRRCSGCSDQEKQQLDVFQAERSPERLESILRSSSADQLRRLVDAGPSADSLHSDAVAWERAVRAKDFATVASLNGRSDPGFRTAYASRILDAVMGGTTSIKVDPANPAFTDFVRSSLDSLLRLPSGFRLIVELLATGQVVNLRGGADQTTQATDPEAARGTPAEGGPKGSGSTVTLNPAQARNQVGLGGAPGSVRIIQLDPSMTVGHELIHALNNARGESAATLLPTGLLRSLGGVGLVRDPVTGEPQSPEELRTITGQTTFTSVGPNNTDGSPTTVGRGAGISENDLRREAGLDLRVSHFGAIDTVSVPIGSTRSLDAMVARYRLPSRAVPPAAATAIRALLEGGGLAVLSTFPADPPISTLLVPTGGHVVMHIRFVLNNAALADQLDGLTVS
jgi:hypothetical protein